MKKYELIPDQEKAKELGIRTCYQIRSLTAFSVHDQYISPGELGGWIEKEENLSQRGNCWIRDGSVAIGNSKVEENAVLYKTTIKDNVSVKGYSILLNSVVSGDSIIFGGFINQCEVQNSFIDCDCFNIKLRNDLRCAAKKLKQLPPRLLKGTGINENNIQTILSLISKLNESDRNKLFRKLTEML